jgi:hypothetical protein
VPLPSASVDYILESTLVGMVSRKISRKMSRKNLWEDRATGRWRKGGREKGRKIVLGDKYR